MTERILIYACGFVVGLLFALFVTDNAEAAAIVKPDGAPADAKWQSWADQAPVWLPDRVTLTVGSCPYFPAGHVAGCQVEDKIWVSKGPRFVSRFTFLHELGHAVDSYNTGPFAPDNLAAATTRRRELAAAIGWKRWKPEGFANLFALCATPNKRGYVRRAVKRTRPLCRLLRHAPEAWVDPHPLVEHAVVPPVDPGVGHSTPVEPEPAPDPGSAPATP